MAVVEALLLAPGAGADRTSPTLVMVDDAVAVPTERMDFPYRKEGRKAPDRAPKLIASVVEEAAALAVGTGVAPDHIAFGGRSMGGRICSMAVADGLPAAALVLLSYPLHPPGRPEKLRIEHLPALEVPCLFVGGTRDPFGTPDELERHTAAIPGPVTHVWVDGGHSPKGQDARIAAIVALADQKGRRRLLLWSAAISCFATVAGAFSPTIEVLGATQTLARGFQTATTLLLAVVAAEEMPKGARAYAISVMTMTGALGAGMAVWVLPLADTSVQGWRVVYLLPIFGLPVLARVAKTLPESQRFVRPHRNATVIRGHARRFWAIGAALFCSSAFGAPASQLLNDFLKDERGFSASRIALFTVLTSTPAGLSLVAGGRLADTRGRRHIVAIGVSGGAVLAAIGFTTHGWPLWVANLGATMLGALAVPALGAYGPELFPTAARAKANGILQVVQVLGSAGGLVVAGIVTDRTGRFSDAMFLLLPLALMVAVLALTVFPETARRELEELNPEDDLTRPGVGEVLVGTEDGATVLTDPEDGPGRR